MGKPKDRIIPSMFQRRVLLLSSGAMALLAGLVLQMVRLSVVQGAEHRAAAEASLDRVRYLPMYRGRILDRHGRVLAEDRAGFDLAVRYEVVTGSWVVEQSRRDAQRALGRSRWLEMSDEERTAAARVHEADHAEQVRELWKHVREWGGLDAAALNERLDAIKCDVQSMAAVVWSNQRLAAMKQFAGDDPEGFEFVARPIREQEQAHVVLAGVSEEAAFAFRRLSERLPGMFEVQDSRQRAYPWQAADVHVDRSTLPAALRRAAPLTIRAAGIADHILGSVREGARFEDIAQRPFYEESARRVDLGGYRATGDRVGVLGIERSMERVLRGTRGRVVERRDSDVVNRTEPRPGADVQLTIDIMLQARIQALLAPELGLTRVQAWHRNEKLAQGTPLNAAAVVIEVETGEVLAMVSMPTLAMGREQPDEWIAVNTPWINRPIEATYPPGSIIKPLVLTAAIMEDAHSLYEPIACTGWFFEHSPHTARCWIYREQYNMQTHGSLVADEAIARSCNIFFETLADRLGMQRLNAWLSSFGLGQTLDVGLLAQRAQTAESGEIEVTFVGEASGRVPDPQETERLLGEPDARFRTVIGGIGQGEVTWTPLQAANAYAQLARGAVGGGRDATILMDDRRQHTPRDETPLPSELVQMALEGLRQSVMEPFGTGNHITYEDLSREPIINATGVTVWAKTGTAQAPPWYRTDTNGDGEVNSRDQNPVAGVDHAWFVGLVGPAGSRVPMYSIAVIVEYGGSGGRVAGPIANQIIRTLQAEGYLPTE